MNEKISFILALIALVISSFSIGFLVGRGDTIDLQNDIFKELQQIKQTQVHIYQEMYDTVPCSRADIDKGVLK